MTSLSTITFSKSYNQSKKLTLLTVVLILNVTITYTQEKLILSNTCSFYGEKTPYSVYTFTSDKKALTALKLITDASGISQNFTLLAADIPNAAAVIMYNKRYILYNQTFIYNISQRINYWASLSILAHEVGHHLNGHSLIPGGSRPSLELEADMFSGFILGRLGADLEQAQSAINNVAPINNSNSHPGRSARLAAVANGWLDGSKNIQQKNNNTYKITNNSSSQINKKLGLGINHLGGIIYDLEQDGIHGKVFQILGEKNYFDFMNLTKQSSEWRLPTEMDYELMYNNLQKLGKFQFLQIDKPEENGSVSYCCSCSFYWIPNTYNPNLNAKVPDDCKSTAKFYNFCGRSSDWTETCTDSYLKVILVRSF
jgi:hypothetical protein